MNEAAKIAAEKKVRLQKKLIVILRAHGRQHVKQTWKHIRNDEALWAEIIFYDLGADERRSQLKRVAFPRFNGDEVNAAIEAGANLNMLYALACGRAKIAKDSAGNYQKGQRGLKIVLRPKVGACE